jgi:hypothetical protein
MAWPTARITTMATMTTAPIPAPVLAELKAGMGL